MMRSFKALDASHDKRFVGEGHEARLAREGVVCGCSQSRIDWVREGRDVGIIKGKRRGVNGDINRTQVNKQNTAMHSTQGRGRKRRSLLSLLDVL
jgi:hypothetical protein